MKKKLICALLALSLALPCALAETVPQAAETAASYDALYAGYTAAYQTLDGVLSVQPGTAGSSLRGVIAACGLLDWAQELPEDEAGRLVALLRRFEVEAARDEARLVAGDLADQAALAIVLEYDPDALAA